MAPLRQAIEQPVNGNNLANRSTASVAIKAHMLLTDY
jgi:hypothetical protein